MSDDRNMRGVYETLKKEGYTPPEFGVFVNDMRDEKNLRGVYETLKREGYTPPEFGVFRTDMFGAAGDSPQSSGTSAQPQSSGPAAASQGNAVSGQSRAVVTGETEPVMDTRIFPDVTDAVAGDGIATAEAVQKEEVRTPSGQKSGGSAGSGTVGSNAVGDENRHAGTRLSGAEQLRVAAHELEAAEAAQRISDDSRREKKEAAAYRKMLLENARAMAERNKEGRRRADEEGIDWDAAIAAVEGKEADGGKESADGRRDSRGVVHEDVNTDMADIDAEVSYDEQLSPQAAAKKRANDAGSTGRHVSTEEARAMSTEAPRGLYYHKDAGDAAGREPFAADTRVMNDPEDIYVTPAGSGIDPRGASADPIALPEVTVTGSSRSTIMKRVAEMRYLDGMLAKADDTELRARASSDLRKEREEADRRVEQFRTEHPGKWRGMSEDEREALRESMAGEVEFERLASTLDSRTAANRREQERRMAEIEKDVRESLAATPEGRRILAGRDSDMDVMRRVDLAAGYDSELRALRQEAWNLGALDEAKAASEGDGGRETVWNFMKGVGRGLREIAVNPLGLRSMHNDATQLVRVAGKLKRGEELTETEQRAVESHFSRLAADGHYEKSQAGKAGEFTAALAEIAVEFGLNPASGAVRRTLTGIAREVGPAAVRATLMNAPVLLYKLGVSSASVDARRFAGNVAKVIGAAIGEGASASVTTQLARNLEESVGRSLAAPVYDGEGKLTGLSGDQMGNAMAKTFTASAGTNAAFMFPATFGGEAVKGIGRAVKYLDKRGMGLPFGNPVDAFVKMKSGEVMSVIASDAFGRADGDPEMGDVLSEESARDMIIGLLAAEFTTGIMKSGASRVRSLRSDVGVMRHESEVKVAAARMASLLRGEDGRVDKDGLMILGSVMRADKEMNPGEVAACLRSLSEKGVPAETCQAVVDYLRASYRWKGAVAARERMRAAREERDWREGDLGEESRAGSDPRSTGETSEQSGLQSDQAVQSEKARQAAESAMRSGYEAEANGNAGDLLKERQEAERMMADAFEYPDVAMEHFGEIDDAGGIVAEIRNNDKLNERQKKAAEAYVMSLLAAHGQEVRRADDRRDARDRIRDEVAAMTNREGNIQPVVLKADDRRVMVTSGELRLSDDGSTVLASESSPVIWVYDPEDGKKKAIYPGAVLSVEPVMSAEAETERRIRILEDEELREDAARADVENADVENADVENADSGMNSGASASAGTAAQTEAGTESETEASGAVRGAAPEATDVTEPGTPDIDAAIARAKEAMERFEEMFDGEQEYWLSIVNENPEEILSNPDLTDAQKDAAREYVEAMQDLAKADAAYGDSPEEKSGESGLESEEKSVTLQHGDGSEQDNDGLSAADNGGAVAGDTARGVEADRDRSDIRVYEEGLGAAHNEYSEHSERNRREAESERLVEIARRNGHYRKQEEVLARGIKYTKGSGESEVVIDHDHGRVYKIKDPYAKGAMKPGVNPEDAIYEHLVHNRYFPETAYGSADFSGGREGVSRV